MLELKFSMQISFNFFVVYKNKKVLFSNTEEACGRIKNKTLGFPECYFSAFNIK